MEKIAIIDETFDPFRCESYNLSVQISMMGYKICVIDTVRDSVILLITSPFDVALSAGDDWGKVVNNLFVQDEVLTHKYKNVFFTFESPIFTIVPTELFVPEKSKMLLDLVHPLPNLFEIRYNHVKELNATIIYALPTSLASGWLKKQPKTKFIGYSTPLVTLSALAKLSKDEPINYTYFSEQCFINVIAKNKELLYCNSFTLYDINDTAYHLINSCKLLGFDPNKMDIAINGSYSQLEALESFLAQYFRKVSSNSVLDAHNFAYAIAKYKNIHWNLFNLTLCE